MPGQKIYRRFKIAGHIIFWLGSISLLSFIFYIYNEAFSLQHFKKSLVINSGLALAVYFNIYYLIPKFLKQKNYIFYVFWLIILISVSSLLIQLLFIFPFHKLSNSKVGLSAFDTSLHSAYFFSTLVYVGVTSFLKFIKDWVSMQDINLKLVKIEQQKLEAELKTLKGQLNPHFLFNSLNNIYSLALIKSDRVPELILRLSDLMRHIIYESKENYISLEKEIEFVNNFVALQKIRTSEKTKINYEILGEMPSAKIAPLLFEPFIDNAFKHGLPGIISVDYILIKFDFRVPGFLIFEISNNYEAVEKKATRNSGIGIDNVKQRLKLLYRKKEYNLTIQNGANIHTVLLKLKLK